MKIIIVGCGKVGKKLAEQLSAEGHDITVIDSNSKQVETITTTSDVLGICGNGASFEIQRAAGIQDANLLIAATQSDELNLLCCLIARKSAGCHTIARVRSPLYSDEINYIKEELGLSMIINPERAAAREISRLLRFPSAIQVDTFGKGRIEMITFIIPEGNMLCNKAVKNVAGASKSDILIACIERDGEMYIPKGDFVMQAGDVVSFVATPKNADHFFKSISLETNRVKDALLLGGGEIAFYLAQILLGMGIDVKIMEKNRARCEELSELLPGATILNGDVSHREFLLEEGLASAESVVALTGLDEENVILSMYAKTQTQAKIVTKISSLDYFDEMIGSLNLDSIIDPKHITTEIILQYVRAMQNSFGSNVVSLYRLNKDRVEALEFHVSEGSSITGKPIMELPLKKNILIASIIRDNRAIIPRGNSVIRPDDAVIVVTTTGGYNDISDILE